MTGSPRAMSCPAGRTFAPAETARPTAMDDPTTATSSRPTTAFAPSGRAAPADTRTASPNAMRPAKGRPAWASPITVRLTGEADAGSVSSERRAKPSMLAVAMAGRSSGAVTVSARTQPCASVTDSSSGSRTVTRCMIRSCASPTESINGE
jgi:hypothetical protein